MKLCLKMTGCKNNRYELDQVILWCAKNGVEIVTNESEADFCVINTCTVTHVADKKSRQMVRSTKNKNPHLKTIVFGCAARTQKQAFEKIDEVDYLLQDLPAVLNFLDEALVKHQQSKRLTLEKSMTPITRSRALVQVQDGCDTYCSYCIIAPARGKSKSRPLNEIIDEVNAHTEAGFNEVVLTGINIGAYGASLTTRPEENKFAELLEEILRKTEIPKIRISSLGPEYFKNRLFEALKNPRICRHIHLSIQSGSNSVLERMNRRYTVEQMDLIIDRLKTDIPGVAITTDIIVGFPEETDAEFEETVDFTKRHGLAKAHVFPYSIRQNTVAATLPQIPDDIKKERAHRLQKVADQCREEFIKSQIGKSVTVLWEQMVEPGVFEGLTDNYIRMRKKGSGLERAITKEVIDKSNLVD